MTEKQLKEDAEAYALGLLDDRERARIEQSIEDLPGLQAYVSELEDAIAGVALTAPAEEVNPTVLGRVLEQIGQNGESTWKRLARRALSLPGGWPAAAALALLFGVGAVRYEKAQDELVRAQGERDAVVREIRNMITVLEGSDPRRGGAPGASELGNINTSVASKIVQAAQRKSYRLVQDLERVNQELASVRNREAERATAHPGVARPLVVSMWDPDVPIEERENANMLSEQVSDMIGDQLETAGEEDPDETDAKESDAAESSMSFDSWPEVEVTGDSLAPLWFTRDLPNGPRIRHKDFPVEAWSDLGLTRYDNGTYYDPESDLLYSPSLNGTDYLGKRPPAGFDPQSGVMPEPVESVPAPQPIESEAAPEQPLPKAFTIYDETTGEGSIILQNLPARADETTYHLWLSDSQAEIPIEVGVLPDLDGGDGRVFFDLQPGLSPSGYILTAEPTGESPTAPGENVILHGP